MVYLPPCKVCDKRYMGSTFNRFSFRWNNYLNKKNPWTWEDSFQETKWRSCRDYSRYFQLWSLFLVRSNFWSPWFSNSVRYLGFSLPYSFCNYNNFRIWKKCLSLQSKILSLWNYWNEKQIKRKTKKQILIKNHVYNQRKKATQLVFINQMMNQMIFWTVSMKIFSESENTDTCF